MRPAVRRDTFTVSVRVWGDFIHGLWHPAVPAGAALAGLRSDRTVIVSVYRQAIQTPRAWQPLPLTGADVHAGPDAPDQRARNAARSAAE